MRYKSSFIFVIYFFLLIPLFYPLQTARAEETTATEPTVAVKSSDDILKRELEGREKAKQRIAEEKARLKTRVEEERAQVMERKEATKEALREKREQIKEMRENFREEVKAKMEAAKAEFQAKREAFKEKLEAIKDERKKQIVERVDTRMTTMNQKRTNRMTEALEHLTTIIGRISQKGATAQQNGKDTTALDSTIATAQTAITAAQSAVSTQAGKEYVITITTESGLKNTVGTTVSQLQADLAATHKAVIEAKQAVVQAAIELAKVINSGNTINTGAGSAVTQ